MPRSLPVRPSLESLKKQAKALLREFRGGVPEAAARVRETHPRPEAFRSLRDAQLVIAREYGQPGWAELALAVERALLEALPRAERVARFCDLACLRYGEPEDPRGIATAARMLEREPQLARCDVYAAATAADAEGIRALLAADPSCARAPGGPRGWPPLLYLTYSRLPEEIVKGDALACATLLLEAGADPDSHFWLADRYRHTAITGAIGEGEQGLAMQPPHPRGLELVEALLDAGADPNDAQGLYNSMFTPGNEWLELLIARGLDAEARVSWEDPSLSLTREGPDGEEPMSTFDYLLGQAVLSGFEARVELLLANGANPNSIDAYGGRPHYDNALLGGFTAIAERLHAAGAAAESFDDADRFQAACMAGERETAEALLAADPSLVSNPALVARSAKFGREVGFETLLSLGADIDGLGEDGRTALHHLVASAPIATIERRLAEGAAVDIRDPVFDATAIGFADHAGRGDVRSLLLDHSRDVFDLATWGRVDQLRELLAARPTLATQRRGGGARPLHRLQTAGDAGREVIRLLCAHGADLEAEAESGETPLAVALRVGQEEVAELLRELGAVPAGADARAE